MKTISLVLLPGLDGTGRLFDPLIRNLPGWIKPIVVSYPRDTPHGYEELRPIVSGALPLHADFVILGESFSGPLAVMAAAEKPDGLQGVILCATFVKNPFRILPSRLGFLAVSPIFSLWPLMIRARSLFARGQYKDLAEQAIEAIKTVSPRVIAGRVKAILNVNVEQDLLKIDVPMLYMESTGDYLIRKHNVEGIRKIRQDLLVAEIDTLHFLLQLEPGKSADVISKFMQAIG